MKQQPKKNTKGQPQTGKKDPITTPSQVEHSNDERIDEDFKGFPHAPAQEQVIKHKKTE